MNNRAIEVLEYRKIIDALAQYAGSQVTREKIASLVPMHDARYIADALEGLGA